MNYRLLGKTGFQVSELSLGTWQVGGKWGSGFDEDNAGRILHSAVDAGVNFIDTADVYESGLSEKAVGEFVRSRSERIYVATKCGRRLNPHVQEAYTPDALRGFVEDSLKNTGLKIIDLIQLHCPPTEVYYRPEIFGLFEDLQSEGKIRYLGVSVEKVEEAIKAIQYSNVAAVQIIFNIFRQRPAELFFELAQKSDVGIIARVPLASGLLTGLYDRNTFFATGDHRFFNREGAQFDKGETFSGVPFETGVEAVSELKDLFPDQANLAPLALKWILQYPEISCVIPGASRPDQVDSNLSALEVADFIPEQLQGINDIYRRHVKKYVHQCW